MINAKEALKLMPSVQRRIQRQEDRLREISSLIAEAARADKSSITILVYSYEEYYIFKILEEQGFRVNKIPNTSEFNTDTDECRFKCLISWR